MDTLKPIYSQKFTGLIIVLVKYTAYILIDRLPKQFETNKLGFTFANVKLCLRGGPGLEFI